MATTTASEIRAAGSDTHGSSPGRPARTARPGDGIVHLWRADLDAVGMRLGGLLDERERERSASIVRPLARRRWIASRGVLRSILGGYLGYDPRSLRFEREGKHGKPALEHPSDARLYFNLSHSGPVALYAVTEMGAVGVDVEMTSARPHPSSSNLVALAERVLGHPTAERLRRLDPPNRRLEFLRAWVKHEADLKRLGACLGNAPGDTGEAEGKPWIAELDAGEQAVAALALRDTSVDFQVYVIDFPAYGSILPADTI